MKNWKMDECSKNGSPEKWSLFQLLECQDIQSEVLFFLTFDDKINLAKCMKIPGVFKNVNLLDDKYIFKKIHSVFHMCVSCQMSRIMEISEAIVPYFNDFIYSKLSNDMYVLTNKNINIGIAAFIFVNNTFSSIYARHMIEFLEDNQIQLNDFPSTTCIFRHRFFNDCCYYNRKYIDYESSYNEVDVGVENYYKNVIFFRNDMTEIFPISSHHLFELFCDKCGSFGHCNTSPTCLLYHPEFEKFEIDYHVRNTINDIIGKITDVRPPTVDVENGRPFKERH